MPAVPTISQLSDLRFVDNRLVLSHCYKRQGITMLDWVATEDACYRRDILLAYVDYFIQVNIDSLLHRQPVRCQLPR